MKKLVKKVSDCHGAEVEERPTQVVTGYLDGSEVWTETRYIPMCLKCDEPCTPVEDLEVSDK